MSFWLNWANVGFGVEKDLGTDLAVLRFQRSRTLMRIVDLVT